METKLPVSESHFEHLLFPESVVTHVRGPPPCCSTTMDTIVVRSEMRSIVPVVSPSSVVACAATTS